MRKLNLGRYDFCCYGGFSSYAICSLVIPIVLVAMGKELNFPLDSGGMGAGGVLHLVRSLAMVVSLLCCGVVARRLGKRFTMGLSVIVAGTGILFCSLSQVYWLLIPCLIFAGLGEGICEGIATPFVQDLHPEEPERYVNIAHSFWSVGIAICVLGAGGLLTFGCSWRWILLSAGALALFSGISFLWKEHPQHRYPEGASQSKPGKLREKTREILLHPRFWLYCAGMFMGAGSEFCLTFWTAAFLELNFKATAFLAGAGTAAIALGMFLGRNFFGVIAKEQNLKSILIACSLGTIPLSLSLSFVRAEYFPSQTMMFLTLLAILFACGIGIAPYWPTLQVYGVKKLPHLDSTLLYIYFSAVGVPGAGVFTWLIGVLGDHFGLKGAFFLIPVSLLCYALIIFFDSWIFTAEAQKSNKKATE